MNDLDWTATPDNQSILAVGFAHRIELLCEQRATYFDETPGWGVCWKLDMGRFGVPPSFVYGKVQTDHVLPSLIPHPISDSIWLARGTLLVGAGHLMFMYGQKEQASLAGPEPESLFEHVARLNGPLDDWNPQMILQCLLWGMSLVFWIVTFITNYCRQSRAGKEGHRQPRQKCRVREGHA